MKANVRIIKENIVILDKDDIVNLEDAIWTLSQIETLTEDLKDYCSISEENIGKSKSFLCDILKILKYQPEVMNEDGVQNVLKVDAHASTLVNGEKVLTGLESKFYASLPEGFTTQEYFNIADRLNILRKTAEKWMRKFVDNYCIVTRYKQGHYRKVFKTFTKTEVFIGNKAK